MYLTKIIVVMLLLMPLTYAYDEETGINENETYSVIFNSFNTYNDINNPKWYRPITDYLIKFNAYFTDNAPSVDVTTTVRKITWNYNLNDYTTDYSVWYDARKTVFLSNETTSPVIDLKPCEEFFKNNPDELNDFITPDQNLDHPDILNVTVDINSDGEFLDRYAQGYITLTDDDLNNIKGMIGKDYGFSLSGEGGEGGLGDIYTCVESSGASANGMDTTFKMLFYTLIPILFILSIINMIGKVL